MFECAGSLAVCAIRISRLDAAGVPEPGADNLIVSDTMIRLNMSPEITQGTDFEQKNGCGIVKVSQKGRNKLKRYNLTLELAEPDPTVHEMLLGGEVIMDGADIIGFALPDVDDDPNPFGVGIEAWTKAIVGGAQASSRPYWRHVFGRTYWDVGDKNLAEEILTSPLSGYTEQNPNFHDGPANDWPYVSDRHHQFARDDDIPAVVCGYQSLAAS